MKIIPDRDKTRKWYLDEDITVDLIGGHVAVIRKGYRFDGHSVPFPFRWLFPQYDTDILAALVHDYLIDTAPWHRFDRKYIDANYTYLMNQLANPWRKFWMPKAVRLAGYWRHDFWGDYRGEPKPNTTVEVVVNY